MNNHFSMDHGGLQMMSVNVVLLLQRRIYLLLYLSYHIVLSNVEFCKSFWGLLALPPAKKLNWLYVFNMYIY